MPTDNLPVSLAIMFMTFGKKTKVAAMQHVFQPVYQNTMLIWQQVLLNGSGLAT